MINKTKGRVDLARNTGETKYNLAKTKYQPCKAKSMMRDMSTLEQVHCTFRFKASLAVWN